MDKLPWYISKVILRRDVPPFPELYQTQTEDDGFHHKEPNSSSEKVN